MEDQQRIPDIGQRHINAKGLEALVEKNVLPDAQSSSFKKCLTTFKGRRIENVWTEKNTYYDHFRGCSCKTYVHFPKDDMSKLDAKVRQFILIGYNQDKFGYRLYGPIEKMVTRSRDVVFNEDQTIEDIDRAESSDYHSPDDLVDIDLGSIPHLPTTVDNLENPPDIDNDDLQEVEPIRSTKDRQQSTRYYSSEYVLLTDGGEPKYFEEAMEGVDKQNLFLAMEDEMKSFHDNDTSDLIPLPKGLKCCFGGGKPVHSVIQILIWLEMLIP
ncbi:hypothetical protein SASPL_114844 [Salvia splendens]|uniref:Retroviral polymerase SH3-like domain-containing protein n=1 Tax=Salvia splendens TaxID=180675 RepID=A0A8X8Y784_SALSN|nr:hypothetical protein SASPL_114844 [Salvia splendens]